MYFSRLDKAIVLVINGRHNVSLCGIVQVREGVNVEDQTYKISCSGAIGDGVQIRTNYTYNTRLRPSLAIYELTIYGILISQYIFASATFKFIKKMLNCNQ